MYSSLAASFMAPVRRLRAAGGTDQGAGEPGRREDLAHRGGLGAADPPGRAAGGGVRVVGREVWRGDLLRGDPTGQGGDEGGGGGAKITNKTLGLKINPK